MLAPAVSQCPVIGVPDEKWGEKVRAIAVLTPGSTLNQVDQQEQCRTAIARYEAFRSLSLVETLPVSAAEEVLKHELRQTFTDDQARRNRRRGRMQ